MIEACALSTGSDRWPRPGEIVSSSGPRVMGQGFSKVFAFPVQMR